ncbi:MAG: class I SAM-dependent methyltransferase [Eubacterium sp.]|jgi:ubiquinone/menaquinone biosynthesis C-methylase UbiE|nr:class I SAM-dependent methyltransferase [Eubacterium sp.]
MMPEYMVSPDITEKIIELLEQVPDGEELLDVGCGDGKLLNAVRKDRRTDGKFSSLCGIDPNPSWENHSKRLLLSEGKAEQIPFENQRFGIVICQCVFSLCNMEKASKEFNRVMHPGGLLILSDLVADEGEEEIEERSAMGVGKILYPFRIEKYFNPFFTKISYENCTDFMRNWFLQEILNGHAFGCLTCSGLNLIKKSGAGYGLWCWKKT